MKRIVTFLITLTLLCVNSSVFALEEPSLSIVTSGLDVTATWSSVAGATGYSLHYAPFPFEGDNTIVSVDMETSTHYSTTLWDGAAYYVAITARSGNSVSEYSNIELFTLDTSAQGECNSSNLVGCPTSSTCVDAGGYWATDNSCITRIQAPVTSLATSGLDVTLSWSSVPGAIGYVLYYTPDTTGTTADYESVDMGVNTSYSVTLWAGASYSVAVTAYDGNSQSVYSNWEQFTLDGLTHVDVISANDAPYNASGGDVLFNFSQAEYTYRIDGFGPGDVINVLKTGAITVINTDSTDSAIEIRLADTSSGTILTILLTNVDPTLDATVYNSTSFNIAFGSGSLNKIIE